MQGLPLISILFALDGADLKAWRGRLGLTQATLATYLGVPQPTISRWERGMPIERPALLERALRDLERELREASAI